VNLYTIGRGKKKTQGKGELGKSCAEQQEGEEGETRRIKRRRVGIWGEDAGAVSEGQRGQIKPKHVRGVERS